MSGELKHDQFAKSVGRAHGCSSRKLTLSFFPSSPPPCTLPGSQQQQKTDRTRNDACEAGNCRGDPIAKFIDSPPSVLEDTWPVRSFGMGYSPRYREWWFVEYSSSYPNWAYRCDYVMLCVVWGLLRFSLRCQCTMLSWLD